MVTGCCRPVADGNWVVTGCVSLDNETNDGKIVWAAKRAWRETGMPESGHLSGRCQADQDSMRQYDSSTPATVRRAGGLEARPAVLTNDCLQSIPQLSRSFDFE